MISLTKVLLESYQYDADDFIPYNNLEVGDLVHCTETDDTFKVLEKLGEDKLIVSLTDDPRDIRGVVYGDEVIAHASDQEELDEAEESEDLNPESIINQDEQVIASGRGFNVAELTEAYKDVCNVQESEHKWGPFRYAWLDIENTPAVNGVSTISFNSEGRYVHSWGIAHEEQERRCETFESAAAKTEKLLTSDCKPAELAQHVQGWIMTKSKFRPGLYPMLDEEGVRIYKAAEKKLSDDIRGFYRGSGNWTGD